MASTSSNQSAPAAEPTAASPPAVPAPLENPKTVPKGLEGFEKWYPATSSLYSFFTTATEAQRRHASEDSTNFFAFYIPNIPESLAESNATKVQAALVALVTTIHETHQNKSYKQLKLYYNKNSKTIHLHCQSDLLASCQESPWPTYLEIESVRLLLHVQSTCMLTLTYGTKFTKPDLIETYVKTAGEQLEGKILLSKPEVYQRPGLPDSKRSTLSFIIHLFYKEKELMSEKGLTIPESLIVFDLMTKVAGDTCIFMISPKDTVCERCGLNSHVTTLCGVAHEKCADLNSLAQAYKTKMIQQRKDEKKARKAQIKAWKAQRELKKKKQKQKQAPPAASASTEQSRDASKEPVDQKQAENIPAEVLSSAETSNADLSAEVDDAAQTASSNLPASEAVLNPSTRDLGTRREEIQSSGTQETGQSIEEALAALGSSPLIRSLLDLQLEEEPTNSSDFDLQCRKLDRLALSEKTVLPTAVNASEDAKVMEITMHTALEATSRAGGVGRKEIDGNERTNRSNPTSPSNKRFTNVRDSSDKSQHAPGASGSNWSVAAQRGRKLASDSQATGGTAAATPNRPNDASQRSETRNRGQKSNSPRKNARIIGETDRKSSPASRRSKQVFHSPKGGRRDENSFKWTEVKGKTPRGKSGGGTGTNVSMQS